MPRLKINRSLYISASVRLDESAVEQVNQYDAFVHASAGDVVGKAPNYVFPKDRGLQDSSKTTQASRLFLHGMSVNGRAMAHQLAKNIGAGVEFTASVLAVKA